MEERTQAFVRQVLELLPAPPRVRVEDPDGAPRVVDDTEEDDAFLLALRSMYGDHGDRLIYLGFLVSKLHPFSDAVDAAWKAAPLVFHDKRLVAAADDMISLPHHLVGTYHNFSTEITAILRRHPGPVRFFGLDSSVCPGPELLADWLDMLSEKAVRSLTVVNISGPQYLEFPLHKLRGDGTLISLSLAFFSIRETIRPTLAEDAAATFGSLATLILAGCALDGEALSLITYCCVLTTLKILGSELTAGCAGRGLTIMSAPLKSLQLERCTATALTLDTPSLQLLTLGVSPATDSKYPWVDLHLSNANALGELYFLKLQDQNLTFHTKYTTTLRRRRIVTLHWMKRLSVQLNMANMQQSHAFISLLHRMPQLSHLTLQCADSASGEEGQPWTTNESVSCRCLHSFLKSLVVRDYRGASELAFIEAVLLHGHKLTEVTVHPHATLPRARRMEDSHRLKTITRASESCRITVLGI